MTDPSQPLGLGVAARRRHALQQVGTIANFSEDVRKLLVHATLLPAVCRWAMARFTSAPSLAISSGRLISSRAFSRVRGAPSQPHSSVHFQSISTNRSCRAPTLTDVGR